MDADIPYRERMARLRRKHEHQRRGRDVALFRTLTEWVGWAHTVGGAIALLSGVMMIWGGEVEGWYLGFAGVAGILWGQFLLYAGRCIVTCAELLIDMQPPDKGQENHE